MRPPLIALVVVLAGCVTAPTPESVTAAFAWAEPVIIDDVRSGGEPVVFVTPAGTLLYAAHPGFTHVKGAPGPELITPATAESYLWRSVDGGASWTYVGGGPSGTGPRNEAPGVSDPALATNEDGSLLVFADLAFPSGATTSASTDDGATWPAAQPSAQSPADTGGVDRPWLAFLDGTFYLLYNGADNGAGPASWRLRASEDGVTWRDHATPPDGSFPGDMVADPVRGNLYVGNGDHVMVGSNGATEWRASPVVSDTAMTGIVAQRPAVDDAGTLYFAWSDVNAVWLAASTDEGRSWQPAVELTAALAGRGEAGTHVWPWPVAGAAGRVAVVWLGANETAPHAHDVTGDWFVHYAFVTGADGADAAVTSAAIPGAFAHTGEICMNGTFCEVEGRDRRLGDFITVDADAAGRLHVAYGTTSTGHSISSPGYVRQLDGPRLR